jgi:hypothetical protein
MICKRSLQIFEIGILNAAANFIGRRLKPRNPKAQRNPDKLPNINLFTEVCQKCPIRFAKKHSHLSFNSVNHREIRANNRYQGIRLRRSARFLMEARLKQNELFYR